MPALLKPIKILTKDGEVQVSITLDLNINLNTMNVTVNESQEQIKSQNTKEEESAEWMIPDFDESPKVNFGK